MPTLLPLTKSSRTVVPAALALMRIPAKLTGAAGRFSVKSRPWIVVPVALTVAVEPLPEATTMGRWPGFLLIIVRLFLPAVTMKSP